MARKARAEVAGGLYHVITRGNNRRQIFNTPSDYEKFLSLLRTPVTNRTNRVRLAICAIRAPLNFPNFIVD